ncbi:hypothetical protein BD410DRAFT_795405 [Rickenella mellea]|uniref:Uncharacterized protein n=1 Tax=Rickenella mellea TaxID=50990 RepID=A0A4Y7PPI2_9AGAM|nr:hypothetical protein BD410DRAFT_795405 [Rickenella mellea]
MPRNLKKGGSKHSRDLESLRVVQKVAVDRGRDVSEIIEDVYNKEQGSRQERCLSLWAEPNNPFWMVREVILGRDWHRRG